MNQLLNMHKYIMLFLLSITLVSFTCVNKIKNNFHYSDISTQVLNEKKIYLEKLFWELFSENEFAYTLYGDKPVSFAFLGPTENITYVELKPYCESLILNPSLSLFFAMQEWINLNLPIDSNKYIFLVNDKSFSKNITILLINKEAFRITLHRNMDIFHQIFGYDLTIDSLLKKIENEDCSFYDAIHRNECLLGILLGYGRENAINFNKRTLVCSNGNEMPIFCFYKRNQLNSNNEKEYQVLCEKLQGLNQYDSLGMIMPISFVGDPSDKETQTLLKKYNILRDKISPIFYQDDWLLLVIYKLTGLE